MDNLTYEIVKEEFDKRGYQLISNNYINNHTYLFYICPQHRDKGLLKITYANFRQGKGCIYCGGRARKTQQEYINELSNKKPNIEVIGKYVSLKTIIEHKCKICGHEWMARPDNLLYNKNGCPKCGKRASVTFGEVIERMNTINKNIEINSNIDINKIVKVKEKISVRCKKCNYTWYSAINNLLSGKSCPICKNSKGGQKIQEILNENNIEYAAQKSFSDLISKGNLKFDFYLPKYKCCIEYDGLQHYEPCTFGGISYEKAQGNLHSLRERDAIKNLYCQNKGMQLVRIPYWDYDNIENIILSIIS